MMIGIDIIELERVKIDDNFLKKIAFQEEIDYILSAKCQNVKIERAAALWCVKEAVMKALALGKESGVVFKDIKLSHEKNGKPIVELFGIAKKTLDEKFKNRHIEISLSHSKTCAVAVAILV